MQGIYVYNFIRKRRIFLQLEIGRGVILVPASCSLQLFLILYASRGHEFLLILYLETTPWYIYTGYESELVILHTRECLLVTVRQENEIRKEGSEE